MTLAVDILLWAVVGTLAFLAALRGRILLHTGARDGAIDFLRLLPRDAIGPWLGPGSGLLGVVIATLAGALTPGGPVIGFSIGAAMLKSGAGAPQVIAYSTAWALYAVHRLVMWEAPLMPARLVWLRAAVSLPLPFIAAASAMLLAQP